jgi:hypothetical protein
MFAKHPEYDRSRIDGLFDLVDYGDARLGKLAIGDPEDTIPLQAADLVAHGLRRHGGLTDLEKLGCQIFRFENGVIR